MKKCVYCDMNLPSLALFCKICGRPQKIAFTVLLPLIIVFIGVGIFALDRFLPKETIMTASSYEQSTNEDTKTSTVGSFANKSNDALGSTTPNNDKSSKNSQSSVSTESVSDIEIGKSDKDVEIIIPVEFLSLWSDDENVKSIKLTDEIIASAKSQGFKTVEQLADGSLKYTITKSNYKKYMNDYRKTTAETINELYNGETFASVKKVDYNDDFSKMTVTVDKEKYKNSLDSLITLSLATAGRMYQMFDVDAPQKVAIDIADSITGDVFDTIIYPDVLQ